MDSKKTISKLLKEMQGVRKKRIRQVKAKVDSGTYKINSSALVKALVIGE